jgi:hypothetical protein
MEIEMDITMKTIEKNEFERAEKRLDENIRCFAKRFEPEDRRDRLDFETHLHSIVRDIYRQAQEPFHKALTASIAIQMPSQIFVKTDQT